MPAIRNDLFADCRYGLVATDRIVPDGALRGTVDGASSRMSDILESLESDLEKVKTAATAASFDSRLPRPRPDAKSNLGKRALAQLAELEQQAGEQLTNAVGPHAETAASLLRSNLLTARRMVANWTGENGVVDKLALMAAGKIDTL